MLERTVVIGDMQLKNSLVMAPVALEKSDYGTVSDEMLHYYDERTKGGYIGLVIIEHSFVLPEGKASPKQLSSSKDEDIEGLKKLADIIHQNGCKTIMQISHAGLKAVKIDDGMEGISPSGTLDTASLEKCRPTHAATQSEIDALIDAFRNAALRVKAAGFDGVEIHGAHGYLLNQFYSPLMNQRTDSYTGQTIEGRVKLHQEILAAVRSAIGDDLLLGIRFGACDYMPDGSTVEDGAKGALLLEEAGAQFIDVSGGMCGSRPTGVSGVGYFADASSAIRKSVSVPVILTGGVKTRADAESLLSDDVADLIGVGRGIMSDPLWAQKAMS